MENFSNSVKTFNENSQAVQRKERNPRAFWSFLLKKTLFYTAQPICGTQQQICSLFICGWIGQKAASSFPTKNSFLSSRALCFWWCARKHTSLLPICDFIFQILWENINVKYINKSAVCAVPNNVIILLKAQVESFIFTSWNICIFC